MFNFAVQENESKVRKLKERWKMRRYVRQKVTREPINWPAIIQNINVYRRNRIEVHPVFRFSTLEIQKILSALSTVHYTLKVSVGKLRKGVKFHLLQ